MAKICDQPITSADIEKYLNSQDDFALEMQVYSLASSLEYQVSHGGTYEDPITKKLRQYDMRAFVERNERRVDLAIECKSLKQSYPLVVSRIPRIRSESYHQLVCSLDRDGGPLRLYSDSPSETLRIENRSGRPVYAEGELVGKSTTQVGLSDKGDFISGDTEAYDKWSQALSSLAELAGDACRYKEKSDSRFYLTMLFPILVIPDGTLWVADYDTSGRLVSQPHSVDETTLFMGRDFWRIGAGSYNVSHLHIFTFSGVKKFMSAIQTSQETWEQLFPMKEVHERLAEA